MQRMNFLFTLKLILRSWWRNKLFFAVAVISLSVGLACTNLLLTYFVHDYFIEQNNPDKDRIFALRQDNFFEEGQKVTFALGDVPPQIQKEVPGVESFLRLQTYDQPLVRVGKQDYTDLCLIGADSTLMDFFPPRLIAGDLKQVLTAPGKIAVSRRVAERLWGDENPLGQEMWITASAETRIYEVAAVWEEQPQAFLKMDLLTGLGPDFWGGVPFLKLRKGTDPEQVQRAIRQNEGIATMKPGDTQYYVEPLSELYFVQPEGSNQQPLPFLQQSPVQLLYVGLLAALLVLFVACCNYVNMNLSRFWQQLKMIHVEKLMGGTIQEIRMQLFGDVFLTVLLSFLLSLLLIHDVLPLFNSILGSRLQMSFFFSGQILPLLFLVFLILSLVPSWYASRRLIRLSYSDYRAAFGSRQKRCFLSVLVLLQFAVTAGLVLATGVAARQQKQILERASCYEGRIEFGDWETPPVAPFREELLRKVPGVITATVSGGRVLNALMSMLELPKPDGTTQSAFLLKFYSDTTLLDILNLRLLTGTTLQQIEQNYAHPALVNESYVRTLVPPGISPIGHALREFDAKADSLYVLAGVVPDFPVNSLEHEISPAVIYLQQPDQELAQATCMQIRLAPEHREETLRQIAAVWEEMYHTPFQYTDMHRDFLQRNMRFLSFFRILTVYASIALLLTAFGIFGISWYAMRQRVREMAIRKVYGAGKRQILWLLLKPFLMYALGAYLVGIPLAAWAVTRWLQQFAYRVSLSAFDLLLPLGVLLGLSFLIVGVQACVLLRNDVVRSLKTE